MKQVCCPICRNSFSNTEFRFSLEDNAGHNETCCPSCRKVSDSRKWIRAYEIHTAGKQAELKVWC